MIHDSLRARSADDSPRRVFRREPPGGGAGFIAFLSELPKRALKRFPLLVEYDGRGKLVGVTRVADYELRIRDWRLFYRVVGDTVEMAVIGQKRGDVLTRSGRTSRRSCAICTDSRRPTNPAHGALD